MSTTAILGTTSYGFRYLLMDRRTAPPLPSLVTRTRAAGLEALQVCENARPLEASPAEWRDTIRAASSEGVQLHAGCMTLDIEILTQYLGLAGDIPGADTVRIVLEDENGVAPTRDDIVRFLDAAMARLDRAGMRLAIENHFHIPCRTLAEVGCTYPVERVAFCIDSANSLRNFESAEQVFDLLDERAAFYHLKDFRVEGSNVGFSVKGAPLGEGAIDVAACLNRIFARHKRPLILLENWVPQTGNSDRDADADAEWLSRSLENVRRLIAVRARA